MIIDYILLFIEYDFFTSIIGGYLHSKFEVFSVGQSNGPREKK